MLVAIHNHLRAELTRLGDVIPQVADGHTSPLAARSTLGQLTLRHNLWTVGALCAAYGRVVGAHHTIEDEQLFPEIERRDAQLAPVLLRRHEHVVIAAVLGEIDRRLVAMVEDGAQVAAVQGAVDRLSDLLLAHLGYEEDQLLEPIGRLRVPI